MIDTRHRHHIAGLAERRDLGDQRARRIGVEDPDGEIGGQGVALQRRAAGGKRIRAAAVVLVAVGGHPFLPKGGKEAFGIGRRIEIGNRRALQSCQGVQHVGDIRAGIAERDGAAVIGETRIVFQQHRQGGALARQRDAVGRTEVFVVVGLHAPLHGCLRRGDYAVRRVGCSAVWAAGEMRAGLG